MKRSNLSICIVLLIYSCLQQDIESRGIAHPLYKSLDSISIYDDDSYRDYKYFLNAIKISSYLELCEIDSLKASIDFAKNKLTYFHGFQGEYLNRSLDGLPEYLKTHYNINSIQLFEGCILTDSTNYTYCYENTMSKHIEKRYGIDFIETVKTKVDSIYLYKHKDAIHKKRDIYSFYNNKLLRTNKKTRDSMGNAFSKRIVRPKDFHPDDTYMSYAAVYFVIYKNGTIDSLDVYTHNIEKKHEAYIKSQVRALINNEEWQPYERYGLKLNTDENFFIMFK